MAEKRTAQIAAHKFAWDGLAFEVPDDWHLSLYHFGMKMKESSVEMEDDEALRLQMEWLRPKVPVSEEHAQNRYMTACTKWQELADNSTLLSDLAPGWTALVYTMPSKRRLVAAWWIAPDRKFVLLLKLHFDDVGHRHPEKVMRHLADTFSLHAEGRIPWACYDMSFALQPHFRLVATGFQAGCKLMVFQWRLRKLYMWQVSLADIALKGRQPNCWAAEFLNAYKPIKGVVFSAGDKGTIDGSRGGPYRCGHYDEIGRMCFRYHVGCRHDPETNSLRLMLFNYRHELDLRELENALDPAWLKNVA